mgnify:CR=1 FL=1
MMKHNWRTQQQNFFDTEVEFLQDKRILDFFDESPLEAIGDVSYFKNKLPFYNTKHKEQCLIIINRSTSKKQLIGTIKKYKQYKKICVAVNKFHIYSDTNDKKANENYDVALLDIIKNIFHARKIKHFFVKKDTGENFNFASPTTQFFIT